MTSEKKQRASDYKGSLLGKKLHVAEDQTTAFEDAYGWDGFSVKDQFTVCADMDGKDGSPRILGLWNNHWPTEAPAYMFTLD